MTEDNKATLRSHVLVLADKLEKDGVNRTAALVTAKTVVLSTIAQTIREELGLNGIASMIEEVLNA